MNTSKIISFILLCFACSSLISQDNYLIDSLISLDVLNDELDNRTIFSYDDQDRITREESLTRLIKYTYSADNKVEMTTFTAADTMQYFSKRIETMDTNGRLIFVETYDYIDDADVLIAKDTLSYRDNDTDYNSYKRYTIVDGTEYLSSRVEFFHNNDGFIDSTSVINFNSSGEISSSIIRGITLNAFNEDSIVANRRFFNEINYLDSSYLVYDNEELIEIKIIRYQEGVYDETFLYTYVREGNKLTQIGNRSSDNVNFVHFNDQVYWETENEFFEYDSTYNISYSNDIPTTSRNTTYELTELSANQVLVSEILTRTTNGTVLQQDQKDSYYSKKNTVDVSNINTEKFTLYPNPLEASTTLTVEAKSEFNRIVIHDINGAVIKTIRTDYSKFKSVNVPAHSGTYIVSLFKNKEQIASPQQIIVVE